MYSLSTRHYDKIDPLEFKRVLDFAYSAHQEHSIADDYRQGGTVPFVVHPLWCAMMLVNDTGVPFEERRIGYQALLLHDVLEDTSAQLPDFIPDKVKQAVQDMTYSSWEEELRQVPHKSSFIKLLKLYDKIASMYDENVGGSKRREWKEFTAHLIEDVEQEYGSIRIVQVAKAIIAHTDW